MKRRIVAALLAVLCSVSVLCTGATAGTPSIHENELEKYILKEMSDANILGLGISVVSAEKELYCAAYGTVADTGSDFVLGPVSKAFTAAAIMQLSENGDLSLEDTVSEHLSGYDAVADVTIEELLNQTSGIMRTEQMSDIQAKGTRGKFEDANANYNLLGEIIESVSGMTYEEYLSDNILDANEMTSTYSMRTEADRSEELLNGYQTYFGFPSPVKYSYDSKDNWMQVPSGYMISDAKDMGKYLQMYLKNGGDVLSDQSIDRMLHGETATTKKDRISLALFSGTATYGMGWAEKEVNGQKILYTGGNTESFSSMMVLLPEQDMGIVMLFNSADPLVGQKLMKTLEEGIVSIEMGQSAKKIDSNAYMLQHGVIDVVMLLLVIFAWIPIFMMGTWSKHRKKKLFFVPGMVIDVVLHVILPTALVVILPNVVSVFLVKRFTPDVYYAAIAVIASLYLGAVVKLLTGIAIALKGKKKDESEDAQEEDVRETEAEQQTEASTEDEKTDSTEEAGGEKKSADPSGEESKEADADPSEKETQTEEESKDKEDKTEAESAKEEDQAEKAEEKKEEEKSTEKEVKQS